MKKIIYIVLFSVCIWSNGLSNKPILPTIDNVKNLAMMEMVYTNKLKDKEALKKQIAEYPSPMELSKMFVKAYLNSDDETMLKIAPKEMINKFKEHDMEIRDMLNRIEKYDIAVFVDIDGHTVPIKEHLGEETVYLHIKNQKMKLKFGFIWVDDRWVLVEV